MATTTTNLGLTKPAYSDSEDVSVLNSNMDLIDAAFGDVSGLAVNTTAFTSVAPFVPFSGE